MSFICDSKSFNISYIKMQKTKEVKIFVDKNQKNHVAAG